jgi:hypothetical protein
LANAARIYPAATDAGSVKDNARYLPSQCIQKPDQRARPGVSKLN